MTAATLIIPISFVLVVAGLLWFVIYAKGWWWVKVIYMVIVLTFGVMIWNDIESYRGWPTAEQTPQRFVLLWADVHEPEPKTGFEGTIYVWLVRYEINPTKPSFFDYRPETDEPRAYKLPYSRKAHEQMEKAKGMIKDGKIVIMERRKGKPGFGKPGEGGDEPGESEKDGNRGRLDRSGGNRGGHEAKPYDEFFFYQMPPPAMPEKSNQR